jgi:NAD(P)H-hydrate epimerase
MHSEFPKRNNNWVLTPHPAEAARLLITKTALIEQDRYQSVELLQQQFGGVCVLKGAGSLISDGKKTLVCQTGNPGMASAGMGDVLSGIIASLIAQTFDHQKQPHDVLFNAASAATNLHGKAADLAAQQGERGMIASDLFPFIRQLMNE